MEIKNIIETLNKQHKGTFVRVGWKTSIESAKARKMGISVIKETDTTVRWGIKYENLNKVKAIKAVQPLKEKTERKPWYKHLEETPYIVQHLTDTSKHYLQLFTVNKKGLTKTRYYINGVLSTKQDVIDSGYVNDSEWAPRGECLIMNIPINNIRFIGKEI